MNEFQPTSVTLEEYKRASADLIRMTINQALMDTASVHWRVADTGEQIVRVRDLLAWAEAMANKMEGQQ